MSKEKVLQTQNSKLQESLEAKYKETRGGSQVLDCIFLEVCTAYTKLAVYNDRILTKNTKLWNL